MNESLAKPIVAVLTSDTSLLDDVIRVLEKHFGECDFRGAWHEFDHSSYYEAEMGSGLKRCMLAFERLVPASDAAAFKGWTSAIEERFGDGRGNRRVNLDAGYVDNLKVALISGKHGGHKVAIADGIWVDVLLSYNKGWTAFPWAFPDFRDGTYFDDFSAIRKAFKAAVKTLPQRS
jgi:hypothetical protein